MKTAKVVKTKSGNAKFSGGILLWPVRLVGKIIWFLFKLLAKSPLLLLPLLAYIAYILPVTPHMRTSYTYNPYSNERIYVNCTYWGIHGSTVKYWDYCPFIVILDKDDQS